MTWKEVKKVSGKNNSNVMDNVIGDGDIADLFAEIYSDLYNSMSYNKDDRYHLMSKVEKLHDLR